ncbi:MAG: chemotaxis protein CheA [Candidatus Eisenbacteria bacterium]|uniref:Chemotaxis protein CheA n=1 Tax=Eiseniibacteriota bacterium TaxID=2212470 RepID=A0A937X935_UNCEI|nr:chemotaxis protein CheA [Candidatus Eisenbacteria bacterium]
MSQSPRPPEEAPIPASLGEASGAALPADADLDLLREYIAECREHIEAAETGLLALESRPDDREALDTVFRAFHTIKGTSGFLGLDWIRDLAHLAESLLARAREGEIRLSGGHADLALEACDALRVMVRGLEGLRGGDAAPRPPHYAALLERLRQPDEGEAQEAGGEVPRVGDLLVAAGKITRAQIEAAVAAQGGTPIGTALVRAGAASAADVARALREQKQIERSLRDATVRVSTERLDRLVNLVGELVIAHSLVAADPMLAGRRGDRLARHAAQAGKLVRELQELTMGLRMVPLRGAFQRMVRLTRDLGRRCQAPVRLLVEGADTEIDRQMVEALHDPLVHMVRNAVDHGIEGPAERLRAGKPLTGTLRLSAYHAGDNVVIELEDDGRGLDEARIRARAVARGLVPAAAPLSREETLALIFEPGLTTADRVTDISGRGVGLDVVRRGVEALRGRIDIASTPGRGTRFTLRLPLTLALGDAMVLRVAGERFLLPMAHIERTFPYGGNERVSLSGRGAAVRHQDAWLPLLRLHELFRLPPPDPARGILVAVRAHQRRAALLVDDIDGRQQIVIRSLGPGLGSIPGICGAAILGDGRVGLVLDVHGLLTSASTSGQPAAPACAGGR